MVKRTSKRRLDAELVRQGLFPDTKTALRSILAGDVSTHDRRLSFAGEPVEEGVFPLTWRKMPSSTGSPAKLSRLSCVETSPARIERSAVFVSGNKP